MDSDEQMIIDSLFQFANEFYQHIVNDQREIENVLFSPYSLHVALAMTMLGADGKTRDEMLNALKISPKLKEKDLAVSIGAPQMNMLKSETVEVLLANALFIDKQFALNQSFVKALNEHYKSNSQCVDFVNKPEDARKHINKCISVITKKMIPELLPAKSINEKTRLCITNAIYFKCDWYVPFNEGGTHDADFNLLDGDTIKVKMMNIEGIYEWADLPDMNAEIVKFPYSDPKWGLILVLPNERNGLPDLIKHIVQPMGLQKLCSTTFSRRKLDIYLPRFKLSKTKEIGVRKVLELMGMKNAFTRDADFSKMADQSLSISNVFHQAVAEVDEKGTRASAATAVVMRPVLMSYRPPTPVFKVDHPFIMAIICDNNVPVFLGHVAIPEEL